MPDWMLVAQVDWVDPEVEQDWNRWYDEVHVPDMLGCPGWVTGERYVHEGDDGRRYVAVYEVSGPEALESTEFRERRGWGPFTGKVKHVTRLYRWLPAAG